MHYFAIITDYFLYALIALSLFLSSYKAYHLWAPSQSIKPPHTPLPTFLFHKESGLTLLSLLASTAPFIGLIGTVAHIIVALSSLSQQTDSSVISGPIATALTSTLLGILASLPALCTYHLSIRRLATLEFQYSQPSPTTTAAPSPANANAA